MRRAGGALEQVAAENAALREALEPFGSLYIHEQDDDDHWVWQEVKVYLVRQARAVLTTPSKAGARYQVMRRVCEVAEDNRRIEYPAALIEALDALAKVSEEN